MNTPGTYRLFLIKDIKRRALPEPGSTCFRHFHNMCCRCVQRVFGGRRQHACCLHNQFTSKRNNLPTVDRVNTSWRSFLSVLKPVWYRCAMVKNSTILRDPLLTNKPPNSVFIDLCYDDTEVEVQTILWCDSEWGECDKDRGKTFSGRRWNLYFSQLLLYT